MSLISLAIWAKKLLRLPALLSKFQRLEKLSLGVNRISDISSLKDLKRLTHLELQSNQLRLRGQARTDEI